MEPLKVLILGGYGTFGGRLAQLLADEARLILIIAGRSRAKAASFCSSLSAKATLLPCAFDRDGAIEPQLRELAPALLVDASGPFQAYGVDPYRVVRAPLRSGSTISIWPTAPSSSEPSHASTPRPAPAACSRSRACRAFRC